jgi:integrase
LTFDEAHRLIAGADTEWRTMVTVALRTGLRLGELLALRWIDVDLDGGRLIVRRAVSRGVVGTPKNGRSREVPSANRPPQRCGSIHAPESWSSAALTDPC